MEKLRDDRAGALLRAVADVLSALTARQLARKFTAAGGWNESSAANW
jgi:hypothetical protein